MAIHDSLLPEASLIPARDSSRSRLHSAMKSMNNWSNEDRQIFIASFTTKKSGPQVAHELGITQQALQLKKRAILRRFMHAAEAIPAL